ncbi:hypothetical protein DXT99_25005 [Pontibacter diazotrophicus]|uniref:Uncharacterized protein n=1 Tax=Pontibacter diazotrophicus TaxID=1400979 RepID=A0A3D8L1P9_9BACT|nr:hypothetical protein [Pontibacter diazotrophicus]RDV11295.1 hypothetical protein DXT99_25005 [Pontibacter diazotrophicus]
MLQLTLKLSALYVTCEELRFLNSDKAEVVAVGFKVKYSKGFHGCQDALPCAIGSELGRDWPVESPALWIINSGMNNISESMR